MPKSDAAPILFINKSALVRELYDRLLKELDGLGPYGVEIKSSCIHFVRRRAFAGVHPKKAWLDLTLRTAIPLKGARIRNQEQVSRNRCHQDIRLTDMRGIDRSLMNWVRAAYDCASGP